MKLGTGNERKRELRAKLRAATLAIWPLSFGSLFLSLLSLLGLTQQTRPAGRLKQFSLLLSGPSGGSRGRGRGRGREAA